MIVHEALVGLEPLSQHSLKEIRTESELLFAVGFFSWFPYRDLYHEPFTLRVPDEGITVPDFATEYGRKGMILYEVTLTRNTHDDRRKRRQQRIYHKHMELVKNVIEIEVNGAALDCIDTTMQLLEDLYQRRKDRDQVQKQIDLMGHDTEFFQATWAREIARI